MNKIGVNRGAIFLVQLKEHLRTAKVPGLGLGLGGLGLEENLRTYGVDSSNESS